MSDGQSEWSTDVDDTIESLLGLLDEPNVTLTKIGKLFQAGVSYRAADGRRSTWIFDNHEEPAEALFQALCRAFDNRDIEELLG